MVFREDYGVERPRVRASVGKRMAVACSNKDLRRAQSSDGMVHKMRKTNRVFRSTQDSHDHFWAIVSTGDFAL